MTDAERPGKLLLLTTARLRASNISPRRVRTLVSNRRLVRIGRGVYLRTATAAALAATPEGEHILRAVAAVVRAGPGAALSHQSAAVLHRIDLIATPAIVALTGRPQAGRKGTTDVHLYTTPLPPGDVTQQYGIPVTTVARTVIDLARTQSFVDGVVAADSAIRKRLATKSQLRAALVTCRGRRGVVQARPVVEFASGLSESVLESIARVAFDDCGLPAPELQVWIPDKTGAAIGRTDFFWKKYKTIAEVDGALKYQDPSRARAQLRRDKRLREAGYEVVHFTWHEITTRPDEVAASIRAAFRAAARKATDPAA